MAQRVVVGVSGGVDSAVAAYLMQQQGYDVIGVFMNNWEEEGEDGVCTAAEDFADARRCCQKLGIPYYAVNFAQAYLERVFENFLQEYRAGRTPNPDVLCNREIKFGELLTLCDRLQGEKLVTGHYARIVQDEAGYHLLKGRDESRDQSYFLYMLTQNALSRACFPLGDLPKTQVRQLAAQLALPVALKKDSTGVCFIGERNFRKFLQNYFPAQPGDIRDEQGHLLGRHDGLMYYTIGQRGGMGIGGGHGDGSPWYVAQKDMASNTLIAVQGKQHPLLYSDALQATQMTFCVQTPTEQEFDCCAKIRYRQSDQPCRVYLHADGCEVRFAQPQRAITPGQSVVLYRGEECLGGGIITRAGRA